MPRQAARLVLGRSGRKRTPTELSSSRIQSFSTTPRRWDDLNGANNNNNNNNDRDGSAPAQRGRHLSAASKLSSLNKSEESRPIIPRRGAFPNTLARPHNLGRPGTLIDVKVLPKRRGDGPLSSNDGSGSRPPLGSMVSMNRFEERSDGFSGPPGEGRGGGFRGGPGYSRGGPGYSRGGAGYSRGGAGYSRGGAGGSPRGRDRGGGGSRGRVWRGGGRGRGAPRGGGRGGARGGGNAAKGGSGEEAQEMDEEMMGMPLSETLQEYVQEIDEAGPVRAYQPSTTINSLVGWGPAVATTTVLGQVETAVRAMRLMGGGRAYSELEQSFGFQDLQRWHSAGKPIMYSRLEQKEATVKMLNPDKVEKMLDKSIQSTIKRLKKKHGTDYGAFVKEFRSLGTVGELREKRREEHELKFAGQVAAVDEKAATTKQAILQYGIEGDHPEVEYSEDTWGKLARYTAQGRTYRPADAAKFEKKMRSLIRT